MTVLAEYAARAIEMVHKAMQEQPIVNTRPERLASAAVQLLDEAAACIRDASFAIGTRPEDKQRRLDLADALLHLRAAQAAILADEVKP